jgi:hypothetical protein
MDLQMIFTYRSLDEFIVKISSKIMMFHQTLGRNLKRVEILISFRIHRLVEGTICSQNNRVGDVKKKVQFVPWETVSLKYQIHSIKLKGGNLPKLE